MRKRRMALAVPSPPVSVPPSPPATRTAKAIRSSPLAFLLLLLLVPPAAAGQRPPPSPQSSSSFYGDADAAAEDDEDLLDEFLLWEQQGQRGGAAASASAGASSANGTASGTGVVGRNGGGGGIVGRFEAVRPGAELACVVQEVNGTAAAMATSPGSSSAPSASSGTATVGDATDTAAADDDWDFRFSGGDRVGTTGVYSEEEVEVGGGFGIAMARPAAEVEIVPSCSRGLTLRSAIYGPIEYSSSPSSNDDDSDGAEDDPLVTLFKGRDYTLVATVEVNASAAGYLSNELVGPIDDGTAYFRARLFLCDAVRFGGCSGSHLLLDEDDDQSGLFGDGEDGDGDHSSSSSDGSIAVLMSPWSSLSPKASANTALAGEREEGEDDEAVNIYAATVNITFRIPDDARSMAYFIVDDGEVVFSVGGNYGGGGAGSADNSTGSIDNASNGTGSNIVNNTAGASSSSSWVSVRVVAAMPENAFIVRRPPKILRVSQSTKIYVGVAVGVCGSFALAYLVVLVDYTFRRKHTAMRLAQGGLLVVLAAACLLQVVFAFMYLPTHDIFCSLSGPLVLIPLHIGASVLVARQYRVYATLGLASHIGRMTKRREKDGTAGGSGDGKRKWGLGRCRCCCDFEILFVHALGWLSRLPLLLFKKEREKIHSSQVGFRQVVTAKQTACLVCVLSVPQLVLEIVGAAYYRRGLGLELSDDKTVGRIVCEESGRWLSMAGVALVCFQYLSAVYLAWISRRLPSIFSETGQIFAAASLNILLALITVPFLIFTDKPQYSPNMQVVLSTIITIGIALTTLLVVIRPHIRQVLRNEKLVLSNALGARYGLKSMGSPSPSASRSSFLASGKMHPIHIKKDDPIPESIEERMLRLHEVLRSIEDKSCRGEPLDLEDWHSFLQEEISLHMLLECVELEWDEQFSSGEQSKDRYLDP